MQEFQCSFTQLSCCLKLSICSSHPWSLRGSNFETIPNNEKNLKVLYKLKLNHDPFQGESCFTYSDYTVAREHEKNK